MSICLYCRVIDAARYMFQKLIWAEMILVCLRKLCTSNLLRNSIDFASTYLLSTSIYWPYTPGFSSLFCAGSLPHRYMYLSSTWPLVPGNEQRPLRPTIHTFEASVKVTNFWASFAGVCSRVEIYKHPLVPNLTRSDHKQIFSPLILLSSGCIAPALIYPTIQRESREAEPPCRTQQPMTALAELILRSFTVSISWIVSISVIRSKRWHGTGTLVSKQHEHCSSFWTKFCRYQCLYMRHLHLLTW